MPALINRIPAKIVSKRIPRHRKAERPVPRGPA